MKRNKFYLLLLLSLFICGCNNNQPNDNSINNNEDTSQNDNQNPSDDTGKDDDTDDFDGDGGDVDPDVDPEPEIVEPSITSVSITNNITVFYVGETSYELSAKVDGVDGTNEKYNKYVTFEDYDASIIEIEAKQNHPHIKALKAGTTSLTAYSNGDRTKFDTSSITVLEPIVESISFSLTGPIQIEKNQSVSLTATVNGRGSFNNAVSWSTSVPNIISYSGNNEITITGNHLGSTKLTASCGNISSSIDIDVVTNFNYDSKMTYELVNSQDELTLNERYIIVANGLDKAMSTSTNSGNDKFKANDITRNSDNTNQIVDIVANETYAFVLKQGLNENTYSFDYKGKYLEFGGNKNLYQVTTIGENSSWNISISEGSASISLPSKDVAIKYNTQGSLFSAYSSSSLNMANIQLYKYSSGREQIHFPYDSGINLSTNQTYSNQLIIDGFEPTKIEYSSNNESLATISGTSENFVITTANLEGEVILTANAYVDTTLLASTSITVTLVSFNYSFNESSYALGKNNTLLDPLTCKATTYNLSTIDSYFTFEKTFTSDDTFYILSNDQYLQKSTDHVQSRVVLGNTKTSWKLSLENSSYYVTTKIDNVDYYLSTKDFPSIGDYYFVTKSKTSIDIIGLPTSVEINVDTSNLVKKIYNYDENFDPTGLVVSATYVTSLGNRNQNVTNNVIWDNEFNDNSITGSVSILNKYYSVSVDGLTITNYELDHIDLDISNAITTYVVGENVNLTGLVINAVYKDNENEKSETIDIANVEYSPKTIKEDTTSITITYKGKSSSFDVTSKQSSFVEASNLHKGFHIAFTSCNNGVNYEMSSDGLSSTKFNEIPFGKTVFEIEEVTEYKDSTGKSIHEYRFKLIQINGVNQDSELYLAYDGNDGKKLCLTSLSSDSQGKTIFEYFTNNSDGYSVISKNLKTSLAFNNTSKKFGLNQSGASTSTYSDVTIFYDSSIDYK